MWILKISYHENLKIGKHDQLLALTDNQRLYWNPIENDTVIFVVTLPVGQNLKTKCLSMFTKLKIWCKNKSLMKTWRYFYTDMKNIKLYSIIKI